MKILAVDTSTQGCSIAVTDGERLISELNFQKSETHSRHLMNLIDGLLGRCGLSLHSIDGFAVAAGPGSFTGLRIGLSTVKGLAMATAKPVSAVSSLDALVEGAPCIEGTHACALIDARKQEVFMARYRCIDGKFTKISEEGLATLDCICSDIDEKTLFVGTGVSPCREFIHRSLGDRAMFIQEEYNFIKARYVAALSREGFKKTTRTSSDIVPVYIRKSDAEINLSRP
jgi:tRNA threonylcarbamoyladenosine biosynthesis protein TsaB